MNIQKAHEIKKTMFSLSIKTRDEKGRR